MRSRPIILAFALAACGGESPTAPPLELELWAYAIEVSMDPRGSDSYPDRVFGTCSFGVGIVASGGGAPDVAVFESGTWQRVRRSGSNTRPVDETVAMFVDRFGTDRIRGGETLRGGARWWSFNLTSEPWEERFTARFRMPGGELRSFDLRVPCGP